MRTFAIVSALLMALPVMVKASEQSANAFSGITTESYTRDLKILAGEQEIPQYAQEKDGVRVLTDRYLDQNLKATRRFLMLELARAGYSEVVTERFNMNFNAPWKGGPEARAGSPVGVNFYVEIPGRNPEQVVILGAHYDTTGVGRPGANDNGTGIAAVLAVAREAKLKNWQPESTLRFSFFDGEEWGYVGSEVHKDNLALENRRDVRLMVNLDMIGDNPTGSRHMMFESGKFDSKMAEYLAEVNRKYELGFTISKSKWGPYQSDQTPFLDLGWAGVSLFEDPRKPNGKPKSTEYYHEANHLTSDTTATLNLEYATLLTKFTAAMIHEATARGSAWQTPARPVKKIEKLLRELAKDGRATPLLQTVRLPGARAQSCSAMFLN